jgi:hypothetical protein
MGLLCADHGLRPDDFLAVHKVEHVAFQHGALTPCTPEVRRVLSYTHMMSL